MIRLFFQLEWLKLTRSSSFDRSIIESLMIFFAWFIAFLYIIIGGFYLEKIIQEFAPSSDPTFTINAFLFYYYIFEFLGRNLLQKPPIFDIENFLHLPVSKSKITHFLLLRSAFSPFNFVVFFLLLPYTLTNLSDTFGTFEALRWLFSVVLLSWCLHFFTIWFKQKFDDSWVGTLVILLILTSTYVGYSTGYFDIGTWMAPVFISGLNSFMLPLFLCILLIGVYHFLSRYYIKYLNDDRITEHSSNFIDKSLGIFDRFGLAGELAEVEWKLIIRHKKSRTFLWITLLFLFYGLIFYGKDRYYGPDHISSFLLFPAIFTTGAFMMNYGQLLLSWNSAAFDFYLIKPQGIAALIKGKFLLFVLATFVAFILCLPYVYFGWYIVWLHIAAALFNVGISMHIVSLMSLWQPKPMDINKGGMFNSEGVGMAQKLMSIPIFVLPFIIFVPTKTFFGPYYAVLILGLIGLIGLILFPKMASFTIKKTIVNRYEISENFRK